MDSFSARRLQLRHLLDSGATTPALGTSDALSARLIESAGFPCVYIGSYATAASRFGLPDTGLLSLPDMVEQARTIADAVSIPVIADAESGFNDAANLWRTVRDAVERFRQTGNADAIDGLRAEAAGFEKFIGYAAFAERSRKYGPR